MASGVAGICLALAQPGFAEEHRRVTPSPGLLAFLGDAVTDAEADADGLLVDALDMEALAEEPAAAVQLSAEQKASDSDEAAGEVQQ